MKNKDKNKPQIHSTLKEDGTTFIDKLNDSLQKKETLIFCFILGLAILFSWKIFDPRISLSGDDSSYVMRANEFLKNHTFPSYQGPFFPMILALMIKLKGVIDIQLLKMVSFVSFIASIPFFFFALKGKLKPMILLPFIALYAFNSLELIYSSFLLSESFYLLLESICFFILLKFCLSDNNKPWIHFLIPCILLGVFMYTLGITRNIGIISFPLVIVPMLLFKHYKAALITVLGFLLMLGAFYAYKAQFTAPPQLDSQLKVLLNKNAYSDADGKEDVAGFLGRVVDNSNQYLSKHMLSSMGFRKAPTDTDVPLGNSPIATIFMYALMLFGLYTAYRKKDLIIIINYLFAFALSLATFVILQAFWDQDRLILIFFPFWVIGLLYALYQLSTTFLKGIGSTLYIVLFSLAIITTVVKSVGLFEEKSTIMSDFNDGDKYAGFDPNWQNYLAMCEWCSKNISTKEKILVRKQEMGYVVSDGYLFAGVYKSPDKTQTADTILNSYKREHIRYILQDHIFGTVTNYLNVINSAYPAMLKETKRIGTNPDTDAVLYELQY